MQTVMLDHTTAPMAPRLVWRSLHYRLVESVDEHGDHVVEAEQRGIDALGGDAWSPAEMDLLLPDLFRDLVPSDGEVRRMWERQRP